MQAEATDKEAVAVTVSVRNTSSIASKTVVQFYLKMEGPDLPPHPVLCGMSSVLLQGDEEKLVHLRIDARRFTAVDTEGIRHTVSGPYTLYAGSSQPDEKSLMLGADKPAVLRCIR